jgi:hypothetical protein
MCRNWKLWAGIAAVAAAVAIFAPGAFGAALPLLLLAACPLGMVLMGVMGLGMATGRARGGDDDTEDDPDEVRQLRAEVARLREEARPQTRPATAPR